MCIFAKSGCLVDLTVGTPAITYIRSFIYSLYPLILFLHTGFILKSSVFMLNLCPFSVAFLIHIIFCTSA